MELSWLDAIKQILVDSFPEPLHYKKITKSILSEGLLTTDGATPENTVNREINQSINQEGEASPFLRKGRGSFALKPSSLSPLQQFEDRVRSLPCDTEEERLVIQRIGQKIFRDSLVEHWQGRCPLTGIRDADLLRASHIRPWKDCETDAARLDVHNGLLLSALWDAAFDRGLVTFDDGGQPRFSPRLSPAARSELRWQGPVPLTPEHRTHLAWHRQHVFDGDHP